MKETDINVNDRDIDGESALMLASLFDHLDIVREIVKIEGINVNDTNNNGYSALSMVAAALSANRVHTDAIRALLIEHGALENVSE